MLMKYLWCCRQVLRVDVDVDGFFWSVTVPIRRSIFWDELISAVWWLVSYTVVLSLLFISIRSISNPFKCCNTIGRIGSMKCICWAIHCNKKSAGVNCIYN